MPKKNTPTTNAPKQAAPKKTKLPSMQGERGSRGLERPGTGYRLEDIGRRYPAVGEGQVEQEYCRGRLPFQL